MGRILNISLMLIGALLLYAGIAGKEPSALLFGGIAWAFIIIKGLIIKYGDN